MAGMYQEKTVKSHIKYPPPRAALTVRFVSGLCLAALVESRGIVSEGLRDVTLGVASAAMGHLQEARRLAGKLPPAAPQVKGVSSEQR